MKTLLRIALPLLCLLLWAQPAQAKKDKAKPNYKISITIHGCKDSMLLLGHYYEKGTFAIDTAFRDKHDTYTFSKSNRTLYPGLYFFTTPQGNKYVEFVVYKESPFFSFETQDPDWTNHLKAKGSRENELCIMFHQKQEALAQEYKTVPEGPRDSVYQAIARERMHRSDSLKLAFIAQYPDCMTSKIMLATRDPEVPRVDANGDTLTQQQRSEYYLEHYFDYMPLDEDMIIRTPQAVFYQRFINYFDKYLHGAPPATIIKYADMVIERARPSKEVFKYLVHTLAEKYLQSNVIVYDEIYVHLIKKYYATGDAFWAAPSVIDDEVKRANTWEKLLVGKIAPELILRDTTGQFHSLHSQQHKYTLLVFWSPTCGHCKTMIPELYQKFSLYREKYDIQGFAILSEPDDHTRILWKKFINENHLDWLNLDGGEANVDWREVYDITSTPQIYLLDENHTIVGKKLNAELFERILKSIEHIE